MDDAMITMKQLLLILGITPLLFAASGWQTTVGLAVVTSGILLAGLYMAALGFTINELKFLCEEEFYQLLATIVIAGLLVGTEAYINQLSTDAFGLGLLDQTSALLDERLLAQSDMLLALQGFSVSVGKSASKSAFCSLTGVGVSVASCGAYSGLSIPASFAYQMLGLGVTETASLRALMGLASQYAFGLLLPAGLLLRTFRLTRGAGGLLMAMAVALYLVVPLAIIAVRDISGQVVGAMISQGIIRGNAQKPGTPDFGLPRPTECQPFELYAGNYRRASQGLLDLAQSNSGFVYEFLINTTLTAIVALTAFITTVQQLAKLAGSEIDLSALMRVA